MDFTLKLKNFKVQYYPFSRKAKSYESEVKINEDQSVLISMNQPLKWGAYTVYQSGFEENDNGEVLASVFSVNKDPGRWIKYFGSGLIVLGILVLFIRRNLKALKSWHIIFFASSEECVGDFRWLREFSLFFLYP